MGRRPKPLASVTAAIVVIGAFSIGGVASAPPAPVTRSGSGDPYQIRHTGPPPPTWAAASRTDSTCWESKPAEKGFFTATNAARERLGKGRLRLDPELSKAARKHTKEMTAQNLLHHTTEDALRRRVTFWSLLGENVGVGGTVDSLQTAFMNSPPHRENVVHGSFRHVGIGTVSAYGRLWVTLIFQARDNPGTTLRMPRC